MNDLRGRQRAEGGLMAENPKTPDEWEAAVNAAEACLRLESARLYGLIVGGPGINVARCEQILNQGRARDIVPTEAGVDAAIVDLIREADQ